MNISNYVDLICQKYESIHLNDENGHKMMCSPNNVDDILIDSKHYFFDILYLRDNFMKVGSSGVSIIWVITGFLGTTVSMENWYPIRMLGL